MGCLCLVVLQSVDSYRRVDGVEAGGGGAEGARPGDNHMKNCSCPLHDIVGVVEHHFQSFIFMIIYIYVYIYCIIYIYILNYIYILLHMYIYIIKW